MAAQHYVDVACAYFRGLRSPFRNPEENEHAAGVLEAMARRDWAQRVLDAWIEGSRRSVITLHGSPSYLEGGARCVLRHFGTWGWRAVPGGVHHGATKEAARHSAALFAWGELPAGARVKLGECP